MTTAPRSWVSPRLPAAAIRHSHPVHTYSRAQQYLPNPRFTTSYILVEPKTPADAAKIEAQVKAMGYLALTKDEFIAKIAIFTPIRLAWA